MKKLKTIIIAALIGNLIALTLMGATFAETTTPKLAEETFDVTQYLNLNEDDQPAAYFNNDVSAYENYSPIVRLILTILDIATKVIGSIAVILLIVAGIMMMAAQGNQEAIDKAKSVFKYTIVGLLLTFFSYIIVIFVQAIFTPSV